MTTASGATPVVAQPLAERARVRRGPSRVSGRSSSGLPGRGLGVADDEESHRGANDSLAPVAGSATSSPTSSPTRRSPGNQLAVFTDAREIPEERLQALAREMNFSETVFVLPPEAGGHVRIRIFTPASELPFAGHPTLGTAFVLARAAAARSRSGSRPGRGIVPVALEREGARIVFGWMEQPIPTVEPFARGGRAARRARRRARGCRSSCTTTASRTSTSRSAPRTRSPRSRPDLQRLAELGAVGINCFAGSGARWKTRMFAPAFGVAEDPATGSAAGPLALHLARHGEIAFGDEIEISQGVEIGRPSTLYARVAALRRVERIEVGGSAVIVARGEFRL